MLILGEGFTPLLETKRLEKSNNMKHHFIIYEGLNRTTNIDYIIMLLF